MMTDSFYSVVLVEKYFLRLGPPRIDFIKLLSAASTYVEMRSTRESFNIIFIIIITIIIIVIQCMMQWTAIDITDQLRRVLVG